MSQSLTTINLMSDSGLVKDWSHIDFDLETLGTRLDAVRAAIARSPKDSWAQNYWNTVLTILLKSWKQMVVLSELRARVKKNFVEVPRSYDWWEAPQELPHLPVISVVTGALERVFEARKIEQDLNVSWANARNEMIQKSRQGLC